MSSRSSSTPASTTTTLLSSSFFDDLGIPPPDVNLEVGSGTHAVQTARIMERFEPVLVEHRPDWLVVYGDVNSTMAAALVAAKLGVRIAHVEAGLRSDDRTMPEEINRIVTDRLADLLLTPSRDADETLRREGEPPEQIVFVGNVMIDSLLHALPRAGDGCRASPRCDGSHVVVTLHRPSNVDDDARLRAILDALAAIGQKRRSSSRRIRGRRSASRRSGIALGGVELIAPIRYTKCST